MFASILLLISAAAAPATPSAGAVPFATRGAFFAVSVADLDESAKWYSDKFGLKIAMRRPERDGTSIVVLEGGGLLVELIDDDKAVPLKVVAPTIEQNSRVHGIFKAGIVVDDWDRLVAALKARDVPIAIGPFAGTAENRANLIIRDNSGNYLQFFGNYATPVP